MDAEGERKAGKSLKTEAHVQREEKRTKTVQTEGHEETDANNDNRSIETLGMGGMGEKSHANSEVKKTKATRS